MNTKLKTRERESERESAIERTRKSKLENQTNDRRSGLV